MGGQVMVECLLLTPQTPPMAFCLYCSTFGHLCDHQARMFGTSTRIQKVPPHTQGGRTSCLLTNTPEGDRDARLFRVRFDFDARLLLSFLSIIRCGCWRVDLRLARGVSGDARLLLSFLSFFCCGFWRVGLRLALGVGGDARLSFLSFFCCGFWRVDFRLARGVSGDARLWRDFLSLFHFGCWRVDLRLALDVAGDGLPVLVEVPVAAKAPGGGRSDQS